MLRVASLLVLWSEDETFPPAEDCTDPKFRLCLLIPASSSMIILRRPLYTLLCSSEFFIFSLVSWIWSTRDRGELKLCCLETIERCVGTTLELLAVPTLRAEFFALWSAGQSTGVNSLTCCWSCSVFFKSSLSTLLTVSLRFTLLKIGLYLLPFTFCSFWPSSPSLPVSFRSRS